MQVNCEKFFFGNKKVNYKEKFIGHHLLAKSNLKVGRAETCMQLN